MALPIVGGIARKVFRDASGRFISKAKSELLKRQSLVTGRFLSKDAATHEQRLNRALENILDDPPAGMDWVQIALKYPDRFSDQLSKARSAIA